MRNPTEAASAVATRPPFGQIPAGRHLELDTGGVAFVRTCGAGGSAAPTLLLHGLGATSALNWAGCYGPLSRRSQVVALDHRGHGRGPRVGNRFSLEDCADDAAAVLRTLGLGPAVVVGYSMGGPIAQLLAHRHPHLVAGLILSATARDFRGRPAERLRFATIGAAATLAAVGPPALAPAIVPPLPGRVAPLGWSLAELRRHEPAALLAATAALGRFSSREWIGELEVPAAVVVHQRDRVVPPHRQRKLADALTGAQVFSVDIDHLGITRELPRYLPALLKAYASVISRTTIGRDRPTITAATVAS